MPYAVKLDLETRYSPEEIGQLTDRYGGGAPDDSIVSAALADAQDEIDGYLAQNYTLPLAATPPLLKRIACDIARYRLWKDNASEHVRQGYEDAVSALKRMASGQLKLPLATGADPAGNGNLAVIARAPVFTAGLLARMP